MDYEELATQLMEEMVKLHQGNPHRKMSESMRGEKFVLQYIYLQTTNILPSELSKAMHVSSARIAATLNSLEKKGLIKREIDPNDRRQIHILLTAKGYQLAEESYRARISGAIKILKSLGKHDAQELLRILNKITQSHPLS